MDNLSGVQKTYRSDGKNYLDWMAEVIDWNIGYFTFLSFFNPEQVKGL